MSAYYNELDKFAASWLRELMKAGVIADGEVDERSIEDVLPSDLRGFTQCHFFAGIGVWSYALKQAGWPDDRRVWTGSCPCQPFSTAGKRKGSADERHLWPAFFHLIQHAKPEDVPLFGEQVASKDGLAWLDIVQADLEAEKHSIWPFDLCAAGFGAPHIRQRLYYVGIGDVAHSQYSERRALFRAGTEDSAGAYIESGGTGSTVKLADTHRQGIERNGNIRNRRSRPEQDSGPGDLADTTSPCRQPERGWIGQQGQPPEDVVAYGADGIADFGGMGKPNSTGPQQGRERSATVGQGSSVDTAGCASKLADSGCAEDNQQGNTGQAVQGSDWKNHWLSSGSSGELWESKVGELENSGCGEQSQCGNPIKVLDEWDGSTGSAGETSRSGTTDELAHTQDERRQYQPQVTGINGEMETAGQLRIGISGEGGTDELAYSIEQGREGRLSGWTDEKWETESGHAGCCGPTDIAAGPTNGFWREAEWLLCRDGKYRPVQRATKSEFEQMADGSAEDLGFVCLQNYPDSEEKAYIYAPLIQKGKSRVGRLKGYGNAIVAPQAQAFIESYMEATCQS